MKYLKKFKKLLSFEKPIEDWCKEFDLQFYTINDVDGTVDVNYNVYLDDRKLEKIPIKFGIVEDGFQCEHNNLTNLINSPIEVKKSLSCYNNKLTTLVGCTQKIGWNLSCYKNELTSLEGFPKNLGESLFININKLSSLKGLPEEINGSLECDNNKLTTLEGCPKKIGGHFYCRFNSLISLEHYPLEIGSYFFFDHNPIHRIYYLFGSLKAYGDSLDYNYLRGTNIIKHRFQEALEEVNRNAPDSIPGYKYI